MAVRIRVVLNSKGIQGLLKSKGVADRVNQRAHEIANAVKAGRTVVEEVGKHRARAVIIAYGDSPDEAAAALLAAADVAGGEGG